MADYWESDELKQLAEDLIANHHPHFATAKIAYLFRDKAPRKNLTYDGTVQQIMWGNFSKMGTGKYEVLTGVDLVLEFGYDIWKEYTDKQRRYAVDSLLSTIAGEEDDKTGDMRFWSIPFAIQAFPDVILRYGLPFDELRDMAVIMRSEYQKANNAVFAAGDGDPSSEDDGDEFLATELPADDSGTSADIDDSDDLFLNDLTATG